MTYFTDSVYERMMVQKPIYGRVKTSPAPNEKKRKKQNDPMKKKELTPTPKERKVKE